MICKNCGNQLEEFAAFCVNCGSAVEVKPAQTQPAAVNNYTQPAAPVVAPAQNFNAAPVAEPVQQPTGSAPYDASSYQLAKEYMAGAKTAKTLAIVAIAIYAANWVLGIGSIIPFLGIIIAFVWMFVSLLGRPAAFVCAIISLVKLGKIKKIKEVNPGSIDPQSFTNYTNAKNGAKAAKIMDIIYLVLTIIPLVLGVLAAGIVLVISIFDGGDLIEEIFWFLEDFIEEILYMIGF